MSPSIAAATRITGPGAQRDGKMTMPLASTKKSVAVTIHFLIRSLGSLLQICENRGGSHSISIQFLARDFGRSTVSGGLFIFQRAHHGPGVKSVTVPVSSNEPPVPPFTVKSLAPLAA
jgi:hypothetical protein